MPSAVSTSPTATGAAETSLDDVAADVDALGFRVGAVWSEAEAGTNGTTVGTPPITFDSLVTAMRSGGAYVNVHTDDGQGAPNTGPGDMASGEIRGQVVSN